jgi:hypothetical protein
MRRGFRDVPAMAWGRSVVKVVKIANFGTNVPTGAILHLPVDSDHAGGHYANAPNRGYFKCLLIAFVIWNISNFLPLKMGCNFSSAMISRLLSGF